MIGKWIPSSEQLHPRRPALVRASSSEEQIRADVSHPRRRLHCLRSIFAREQVGVLEGVKPQRARTGYLIARHVIPNGLKVQPGKIIRRAEIHIVVLVSE